MKSHYRAFFLNVIKETSGKTLKYANKEEIKHACIQTIYEYLSKHNGKDITTEGIRNNIQSMIGKEIVQAGINLMDYVPNEHQILK